MAITHGHHQAAATLGIPRRTISQWALESATDGSLNVLVGANRELLVSRFAEAVNVGISAVLEGLKDPKTRLGDRARALEVVAAQHSLLIGDPTARTANQNLNLSVNVADELSEDEQRALVASLRREMELRDEGALTEAELSELATYLEAKGAPDVG